MDTNNTSESSAVFYIVLAAGFIGSFIGIMFGITIGRSNEKKDWQKLMVEKGYAEMIPDQNYKVFNWKN